MNHRTILLFPSLLALFTTQFLPACCTELDFGSKANDTVQIVVEMEIEATPQEIFDILTDHEGYAENFISVQKSVLLQEGTETKNGVGARRELSVLGTIGVDRITSFDPPNGYTYDASEAYYIQPFGEWSRVDIPFNHAGASVEITDLGNGISLVRWETNTWITWFPKFVSKTMFTTWLGSILKETRKILE